MAIECPKCRVENTPDSQFCKKCATSLTGGDGPFVSQTRTLQTPPERLTRGTRFADRYEVIEKLGEGGMGAVYRVEDTKIKEEVALKLINPLVASDKRTIERFRNELKFARKIRHKHVCQMFDLGEDEGTHYITMEYVAGEDLKSFLRRSGKLTIETAVRVTKQVCEGLGEAHRLGIVHRDLKPSNIMIDKEGHARIMDFGIARSLKAKGITGAGLVIGTPEYMSPEQAEGKEADLRADIYSLGVILFEILTGQRPFEGDSALGIAMKHKGEEPQEPRLLNPNIPEAVNGLVLKCLKKNPADRFQNTEEILTELDSLDLKLPDVKTRGKQKSGIISKEITVSISLRKFLVPVLIVFVVVIAGQFYWRPWDSKTATVISSEKPTLAIVYFKNISRDSEIDDWKIYFPEYLMADLGESKFINVLDYIKIYSIFRELDLLESENYSETDLRKIGEMGQASHILTGVILKQGSNYQVNVTLHDANTLGSLGTEVVKSEPGIELRELVDLLTPKIKTLLGITAPQIAEDIDLGIDDIRPKSEKAYDFFVRAHRANDIDQDYEQAIEFYNKALEIEPDFVTALLGLSVSTSNVGKDEEARKYVEAAMKHVGKMSVKEMNTAKALLNRQSEKTVDQTLQAYQEILKAYPDDIVTNVNSGWHWFYLEEYDEAIKYLGSLYGRKITPIPYGYLARAYSAEGLYDKAEECLKYFLDDVNEHAEWICAELALVQLCRGNYSQAFLEVEKSPKSDPNLFHLYPLGLLRYCQEDFIGAEKTFEDLKQSQDPWMKCYAYLSLYKTLEACGRFEEAKGQARSGMAIAESNGANDIMAEFSIALMRNLIQAGHADEALKAFDRSWEVTQKVGFSAEAGKRRLMHLKGMAVLELEDLDEAQKIKSFLMDLVDSGMNKKAIRLFYHLSGLIEERNGNLDVALKYFSDALELAPFEYNCDIYLRLDRALYLEAIGRIYLKKGELDKAVEQFEKIQGLTLGRFDYGDIYARSYYILGKIFEQKGWPGKAIENYEKFLELWQDADPGIAEVEDAKKRLMDLKED